MRNPYDFVRIDWDRGVERRSPSFHDRFEGLSGRIEGTITTLTPFFIPGDRVQRPFQDPYKRVLSGSGNHPIIPGSSLKGMIRSLVETVGYGCWCFPKPVHKYKIKRDFWACTDSQSLCVACRMFGMVHEGDHLKGHVGFEEAVCEDPHLYKKIYAPDLWGPQPEQADWYLDKSGEETHVAGRKFYHHSQEIWISRGTNRTRNHIEPLDVGNVFTFKAHFDSLNGDELALLLYALTLEPGVRHKLGYAKPAGLGSVEIKLTKVELIDFESRYTTPGGGKTIYEADDLETFVTEQTASYRNDQDSETLNDLRSIWAWPPSDEEYGYQAWELRCQRQPIAKTDSAQVEGD
jgi:CRISPR/Cas system CSM-associated protein Csm3 (group 7 of RAMP superfamily)